MRDDILSDIWKKRNAWARTARGFKAHTDRARRGQLALVILGSICTTAAATGLLQENPDGGLALINRVLAGAGAVALGLVAAIQQQFLSQKQLERWPRARSVTEAIKSEVFRFQAGALPYGRPANEEAQQKSLQALLERVDAITADAKDLLPHVAEHNTVDDKGLPGTLDEESYIAQRLTEQIENYYKPTSRRHFITAKRIRFLLSGLALFSAAIAALMASSELAGLGAWVSVITTGSLAVATYASLQRYEFLASTYAKQADHLKRLSQEWKLEIWPDWSAFVSECENTISAENRGWMAKMIAAEESLAGVAKNTRDN